MGRTREITLSVVLFAGLVALAHYAMRAMSPPTSGRDVVRVLPHYDNAN